MDNLFITSCFDEWKPMGPSRNVRFINVLLEKLGFWMRVSTPASSGVMTNVEKRMNMYHLASQVLCYQIPGEFVELGCHAGRSAVLFQKLIDHYDSSRTLHVYDSFEGLPEIRPEDGDTPFHQGQCAVGVEVLLSNFEHAGLRPPVIHRGWFQDTLPNQLPERIAFAHLDGDLYQSIKISLEHVYPRLSRGAICLVDDYCDPALNPTYNALPGVKRACDEFLLDRPEAISVLYAADMAQGYFRKL